MKRSVNLATRLRGGGWVLNHSAFVDEDVRHRVNIVTEFPVWAATLPVRDSIHNEIYEIILGWQR